MDNPTLDLDLNKETTLSKPDDAKPNPKSKYTFAKELEKNNLYLKFGSFRSNIVWNIDCFMHKQIEIGKVMNLSILKPLEVEILTKD